MNKVVAVLATAVLAGAVTASAATISVTGTPNRTSGSIINVPGVGGGEFAANAPEFNAFYNASAKYGDSFATFCLERNESLSIPGVYTYVKNVGTINGGVGGGNPDPISRGTAYLYTLFATGALTGYDYGDPALRPLDAGYLQDAIWYLEHEFIDESVPLNRVPSNPFLALAASQFGDLATARLDNNQPDLYPVFALNLYSTDIFGNLVAVQDVIVYSPVPDGGMTVLMLGAGLTGLALIRRRRA